MMIDRRSLLAGSAALAAAACVPLEPGRPGQLAASLRIIEASSGGTLGAAFLDPATGAMLGHNTTLRFGHCSSFKLSLAALVLQLGRQGTLEIDRLVRWSEGDLMPVSPFTSERLANGATMRELAEATQKTSDNAAANILLRAVGGPERLTRFWREIGDPASRLDRTEPELNNVPPGEERDTTTPDAMVRSVAAIALGDVLATPDRAALRQWTIETATGLRRVRAGLPVGWIAGDKTGTSLWPGMGGLYVDIGWVEPPGRGPLAFAAYFRAGTASGSGIDPAAETVLADVGRVLAGFALS